MGQEARVYRNLQKHLDTMPVGYPATESGVEIRILKHLFTPEEAEIALQLSMIPDTVEHIYKRMKKSAISIEQLQRNLDQMVYKGSIYVDKEGDTKVYCNLPLAIGMYEFQVERLTKDFAKDVLQYIDREFGSEVVKNKILLLRTIPVEKSISVPEKYQVSNYDNVRYLVENARGQIAVANCICRQAKDLVGESCTKTDLRETCIMTSAALADYYVNVGIGRYITKEEALDILGRAQEAGLILQPVNAEHPEAICCCCGDCCGQLTVVKKLSRPADYYASNFYSEVDPDLCTGCEICVEICQMDAAAMNDGVAFISLDRCIGCGNCVVVCESSAIRLKKKNAEQVPPKTIVDMYTKIFMKKMGK
ncbi:MAG: 4Fe-4S binding protein [Dehalococcoidia bacterium]|nr:4Fe-4S binding protein [Dehalococcoidia bacterium]MDH4367883.1 4Fe-4S binding protein [Dehalococcoidia bacterium]